MGHPAENLASAGPSGQGKSLRRSLAHQAIDAGMRCCSPSKPYRHHHARQSTAAPQTIAKITRCDLITVDDIGMLPRQAPRSSYRPPTPPTNAVR